MLFSVNTNQNSLNAQKSLMRTNVGLNKSVQKLSTGSRINSSADDAAGLSIAENLKSRTMGYRQARSGIQCTAMIQTADAALSKVADSLTSIRELALQYNDSSTDEQAKAAIREDVTRLSEQIEQAVRDSAVNGTEMLRQPAGTPVAAVPVAGGDDIVVTGTDLQEEVGPEVERFSTMSSGPPEVDVGAIDQAISNVERRRAELGETQQRIEHASLQLALKPEDDEGSGRPIDNADAAREAAADARRQMLQEQHTARVAQANQVMASVLGLLL